MKTIKLLSAATLIVFFQFSCNSPSETTTQNSPELRMERPMAEVTETQVHETEASDYSEQKDVWILIGSYEGLLPCDDCDGIALHLSLDENMTYHLSQKYVGTDRRFEPRTGKFSFTNNIVTLHGMADEPNKYLHEDKNLIQLDWNGNKRTGANAQRYLLKRH